MNPEQPEVTERDFRMPEFKDAKVEDYERRSDGVIVRKDRWVTGFQRIACAVHAGRKWEVPEVIELVEKQSWFMTHWERLEEEEDHPNADCLLTVQLEGGAVLHDVQFTRKGKTKTWTWRGVCVTKEVVGWRRYKDYDDMVSSKNKADED